MKRTLVSLCGLFLILGIIVVYHKDKSPLEVETHVLQTSSSANISTSEKSSSSKKVMVFNTITYNSYSQEDLELLAHAINAEQGIEYEDEKITNMLQIYAGQVILNRLNQNYMGATTIEEVLYSKDQYACVTDQSWDNPVSARAYKNAELLLAGVDYSKYYGIPKMPDNVIYQAEFEQGSDTWGDGPIMNTYFCYE